MVRYIRLPLLLGEEKKFHVFEKDIFVNMHKALVRAVSGKYAKIMWVASKQMYIEDIEKIQMHATELAY